MLRAHFTSWLVLVLLAPLPASAMRFVEDGEVTFTWDAASGPVAGYGIFISFNGGPFPNRPDQVTQSTQVTVAAEPSSVLAIRVAAFDGSGNRGPLSRVSDPIVFLDRSVPSGTPPARGATPLHRYDFDGDGHTDILWRSPDSGMVSVGLMGPDGPWRQGDIGQMPRHWELLTSSDLDGDGSSDLVWYEPLTGALRAWLLAGTELRSEVPLPGMEGATPALVGDLDGDGLADLLWQAADGLVAWQMDLDRIVREWSLPAAPAGARLACAADFDGDGDRDLLWQPDRSGPPSFWNLDDGSLDEVQTGGLYASPTWRAASCNDFDGDGHDDVIWSDPDSGAVTVWGLQHGAIATAAQALAADTGWKALAAGDFDGDGLANELLLESRNGEQRLRSLRWASEGNRIAFSDQLLTAFATGLPLSP
jgi:hypothetical protein